MAAAVFNKTVTGETCPVDEAYPLVLDLPPRMMGHGENIIVRQSERPTWLPSSWTGNCCPIELSAEAIRQWFSWIGLGLVEAQTELREAFKCRPDDVNSSANDYVKDAYRLVAVLRKRGCAGLSLPRQ